MTQNLNPRRLRQARLNAGLTCKELELRVGLHPFTIDRLETDTQTGDPNKVAITVDTLTLIANELGIDAGVLLNDNDQPVDDDADMNAHADRVVAALITAGHPVHDIPLQRHLGWDTDTFRAAINRARSRLRGTGLTIRSRTGSTALVPTTPEPLHPTLVAQTPANDLHPETIFALRTIIDTPMKINNVRDHIKPHVTVLTLHGLIEERDGALVPTSRAQASLDPHHPAARP